MGVLSLLRRKSGTRARKAGGRPGPGRWPTVYLVAASALGVGLVLAREFTWGVAWEGDSTRYLVAARTLLAGDGLRDVYDSPFTDWPPLYPLLLAAGGLVFDPREVAGPLNLGAFALTIFCLGRYLWARLHSTFLRFWAPLTLALSLPLLESARWAMTETVFILFATLALIGADDYLTDGRRSAFLRAAVFSALAWQTRYIGAAVVLTAGLFLSFRAGELRERAKLLLVFGGITAAPMGGWLWRNYLHTAEPVTQLMPSDHSLTAVLGSIGEGFLAWTDFDRSLPTILTVGALVLGAAVFRALRSDSNSGIPPEERVRAETKPAAVFGVFWCSYLLLLGSALMVGFHGASVHARYLTPLVIPTVVVLAMAADRTLAFVRARGGRLAKPVTALVMVGMSLWLAGQVEPNARAVSRANSQDFAVHNGFRSARWAGSETLRALLDDPAGRVSTNQASAVSLHTGQHRLGSLPGLGDLADEEEFSRWLEGARDGLRLVWFDRWDAERRTFRGTPPAFRVTPGVRPVGEFPDGGLFEVDRSFAPPVPSRLLSAFDSLAAGGAPATPLARGHFDLYSDGDDLLYYREPCRSTDIEARFRLSLTFATVSESGQPAIERDHHDFDFGEYGVLRQGRCLAAVPLPEEGYSEFDTGQRAGATPWRLEGLLEQEHRNALRSLAAGEWGDPDARAAFDLYLVGNELHYFREPCVFRDLDARFFLHFYGPPIELAPGSPADAARKRAFENRDFAFFEYGVLLDGRCLATVPAGDADAYRISTGQFASGEPPTWKADLWPGKLLLESRLESISSGGFGEPEARSTFDLYLDDSTLLFHRASCAPSEVDARFFMHFYPERETDLPPDRRDYGFLNLDFDFTEFGFVSDGRCLARVPLPASAGGRLRTGQMLPDGEVWSAEVTVSSGR